jgi:hypothetical protein
MMCAGSHAQRVEPAIVICDIYKAAIDNVEAMRADATAAGALVAALELVLDCNNDNNDRRS